MGNLLRSDKLQKQIINLHKWAYQLPESKVPLFEYKTTMFVSDSIWDDIDLPKWLGTFLTVNGEIIFAEAVIKNPVQDIALLRDRQACLMFFRDKSVLILNEMSYNTLEWFRNISIMDKNYLYNTLFPSSFYMKWLYKHPDICTLYHWYRCYVSPVSSIIYPISLAIGPLWFLRYKLKMGVSLSKYIHLVVKMILLIKNTAKSRMDWYKFIIGSVVYISLYVYSTIQSVDLSIQLHTFRKTLMDKITVLINVQKKVISLYKQYGKYEFWKAYAPDITINDLMFSIKYKASSIYRILSDLSIKERIHKLCKVSIIHDTLIKMGKATGTGGWCVPVFGSETFIGNMKNPSLGKSQVANPIRLNKHLIISGANAGGKTTYVKSLLWNILLSQSFGVVYGSYSQMKVYDAILHHHRVKDITGDQSLFQAEMFKIKEALNIINTHKHVAYFLDEPMHSTNPVDGTAMLESLLHYLSKLSNIQILLTSHFFSIQSLEEKLPSLFKNVCVKAQIVKDSDIHFDFKIYKGGSMQTIGIELLEKNGFPAEIFEMSCRLKSDSAIEIKKK